MKATDSFIATLTSYEGQTTASVVYVGAMIARDRDTDANGSLEERLYPTQDANLNVTAVTDATGITAERYLLDAYGSRIILDGTFTAVAGNISTVAFDYGHQGGKYDSVLTNQMLFRNRVYDVETMRWTQNDPAGMIDGVNLYQCVNSSPPVNVDPFGLFMKGATIQDSFMLAKLLNSICPRPQFKVEPRGTKIIMLNNNFCEDSGETLCVSTRVPAGRKASARPLAWRCVCKAVNGYTSKDPVIIDENRYRAELGSSYGQRGP